MSRQAQLDATEKQKRIFDIVKPIVDKYDVESLRKLGCPDDEYDPLSERIASGILREGKNTLSIAGIDNLVTFVFHYSFGQWSEQVVYDRSEPFFRMAQEIKEGLASL